MQAVVGMLLLTLVAAAAPGGLMEQLPPGATVATTSEADLNGDGLKDLIVGYTLPREGLPPTEGHALVLERLKGGGYRRFDLQMGWGGHYLPAFTVADLTGDGRPELVIRAAGGGAWQMLGIFRRTAQAYRRELWDGALTHYLWDADGDGTPEVIAMQRHGRTEDQIIRRFRWQGERFVAWHELPWTFDLPSPAGPAQPVPNLAGKTAKQAETALFDAGLRLGAAVLVDAPGAGGKVIRQSLTPGATAPLAHPILVSLGAGDTRFRATPVPRLAAVHYLSAEEPGTAPVATARDQLEGWHGWVQRQIAGVAQVVQARHAEGAMYAIRLEKPWAVSLGGRPTQVRWLGVGMAAPHRGLIYLATAEPEPGQVWPPYTAALYTKADADPLPIPPERPLARYLREQPELDAFLTVWPGNWPEAIRQRGIGTGGWPVLSDQPALTRAPGPAPGLRPDPDHVVVTVLGGQVDRAEQKGATIDVTLVARPGAAHRWRLPLTGFAPPARLVTVNLRFPDGTIQTTTHGLDSWIGRRR